jgi:hypothetical protein
LWNIETLHTQCSKNILQSIVEFAVSPRWATKIAREGVTVAVYGSYKAPFLYLRAQVAFVKFAANLIAVREY